ncbi:MAG TPA: FkbM family methyltransferase [Candidatus Saccharimonadales bacterium]|nr:FkbM family methyltransferase [Candidatus Saccharimonadales bacterium]
MSKLPDPRIYYAQNREDLILESFFEDTKKGFYVDVGACHPHVASVTKRFYLNGWKGINIEPQTELCELFETERKKDINLNVAVSDKSKTITLRTYPENRGLSTTTPEIKDKYIEEDESTARKYDDKPMEATTLKAILKRYKVRSIQFLKIDVEGYEHEVIEGNDWTLFRPEVVCVEADHMIKDWKHLLRNNGYQLVFFDGLNEYYVDSKTDRARKFNYVKHVLMDLKGGIAADDYDRILALKKLNEEKQSHNRLKRFFRVKK